MKIGYLMPNGASPSLFNGIRVQAETWAYELRRKGHEVLFIGPWDRCEWNTFDILHIFGQGTASAELACSMSEKNRRIVCSPIIDTIHSVFAYSLISRFGNRRLRIGTTNFNMREGRRNIVHWYVRSQYEWSYVHRAYSVSDSNISLIPLSYRIDAPKEYPQKDNFCLHVSKLTDERKNVMRLIKAAVKYGFKLKLAGSISNDEDFKPLKEIIDSHENIDYIGYVDDEALRTLYLRAKVFALPSISEGVGLVALEAAACGCDIVVTNIGGPKEYYANMAYEVNPYSIDEIGKAIMSALEKTCHQPNLMNYIQRKYNLSACIDELLESYNAVLRYNA